MEDALFDGAFSVAADVVAFPALRRGRAAAAVASISLPRLVTIGACGPAATVALEAEAALNFFGGMMVPERRSFARRVLLWSGLLCVVAS